MWRGCLFSLVVMTPGSRLNRTLSWCCVEATYGTTSTMLRIHGMNPVNTQIIYYMYQETRLFSIFSKGRYISVTCRNIGWQSLWEGKSQYNQPQRQQQHGVYDGKSSSCSDEGMIPIQLVNNSGCKLKNADYCHQDTQASPPDAENPILHCLYRIIDAKKDNE